MVLIFNTLNTEYISFFHFFVVPYIFSALELLTQREAGNIKNLE